MAQNQEMTTIPTAEYRSLIRKSKAGWKAFYTLFARVQDINDNLPLRPLVEESQDLQHLKNQFLDMITRLQQDISCPICLDELEQPRMTVLNCGHIVCRGCCDTLNAGRVEDKKCPICRRRI